MNSYAISVTFGFLILGIILAILIYLVNNFFNDSKNIYKLIVIKYFYSLHEQLRLFSPTSRNYLYLADPSIVHLLD